MVKNSWFFFFQAEDGIRNFCLSRALGDVYKDQPARSPNSHRVCSLHQPKVDARLKACLLYTSDAADDLLSAYHVGRRLI